MPGLSVVRGDTADVGGSVAGALDATDVFDHYGTCTPIEGERVRVGQTRYDGYPIRSVETEHGTAFLEGRLYDVDDVDAHLERVARLIAADDVAGLREWVGARDGDFLILLTDGDRTALLNDAFGRLPAYHATVDGTAVCSRELSFVREFARQRGEPRSLDRLAAAQLLCFGYYLGTRTSFEAVRAVPPGSLVRLTADDADGAAGVEIESVYEHDFESCEHADRSLEANADELTDRIVTAAQRRSTSDRRTVVSLSGGLDSRTVAAVYARENERTGASESGSHGTSDAGSAANADTSAGSTGGSENRPAVAATFQHAGDRNSEEVAAAGAVAAQLGLDWSVHTVESSPERRETLLQTKQGMNYLGMSFVLDFFEQLRDRYGTTTYVTGDGGDKLLVGLEPAKTPDSRAELVDHVLEANSRMAPAEAAAIANVDPDAIRASVARRIETYPESDLGRAYVHFLVRERGVNFLVQGEDRNRYYAWSVSPFYALPVFEYAMNCPDEQKAYRRLQSAILDRFDPELVELPYPNFGAPVSTRRYCAKQFVYNALERYPTVRQRVVDLVTTDSADRPPVVDAIRDGLSGLDPAGLSPGAAADVVATPGDYSGYQLQSLATVTALANGVVEDAATSDRDPPRRDDHGNTPTGDAGVSGIAEAEEGSRPERQSARADR